MRALWEMLNETKWVKAKDDDRQYVLDAFQEDAEMKDADAEHEPEEEEEEDQEENIHGESFLTLKQTN
jgi:predicted Fe-S protein YdhL (DUF1289 family)